MDKIQMVDLKKQYLRSKNEIDSAIQDCITVTRFIGGAPVEAFEKELAEYLSVKHVISCANGTDALQVALMCLGLEPGDEVIVPAFTYVATAEVIGLLSLTPVMIDVNEDDFNIDIKSFQNAITKKTKAVVPVHLFGQSSDLIRLSEICKDNGIIIIEDNAQSIGGDYISNSGKVKTGTFGHIGCTSFFPSKNLGCYGDGGAIYTNSDDLAEKLRMIARHGQSKKYYHEVIGVNSRLDTIQASILRVKLSQLDDYIKRRQQVADYYDSRLGDIDGLEIPFRSPHSTHVFHQYTLKVKEGKRDDLKAYLAEHDIPSMIYYPLPLYHQNAYKSYYNGDPLPATEKLCKEVLSLPMHTEMNGQQQKYICEHIHKFYS